MRQLRISRQAQRDLSEILDWTVDTFGNAQADTYAAIISKSITDVARGTINPRTCDVVTGHKADQDLHFARAGQHYLILKITPDRLVVLSIVHSQRDLGQQFEMIRRKKGGTP